MKILLATDDSKFAEAAIQAAISQVRQDHTQVLGCTWWIGATLCRVPFPEAGRNRCYSARQLESIIEGETTKAHELVTSAAERLRSAGFEASTSVRERDPKAVILDCATEWGADLIIVGSHGRKGVARFVLGSVSEAVARYARCSVEIVRPPTNV